MGGLGMTARSAMPAAASARATPLTSGAGPAPAPDPVRPPAPPATVEAWLDHPQNGPLQVSLTDTGAGLGLSLATGPAGAAQLEAASGTLRDILERAMGESVAEAPAPAGPEEGGTV
jgi:hypothetical protein